MNFPLHVRLERNGIIIFIFPFFQSIPTYYSLKWSQNGIVIFSEFFSIFFLIFYYATGRNETERQFLFSVFLGLFQPILAWNEATMVFFNFFLFFWNFQLLVRLERNRTIVLFSPFLCVSPLSLAWNEAIIVFYNFLNFFAIFLEFSITCRVGTKQNNNFYFLSFLAFRNLILLQMKPKRNSSNFLNFFATFLGFSITHWVGTKRNETINFIFSHSWSFPTNFYLKRSHNCIFLSFWIFFNFLWIFYYASGWNETEW